MEVDDSNLSSILSLVPGKQAKPMILPIRKFAAPSEVLIFEMEISYLLLSLFSLVRTTFTGVDNLGHLATIKRAIKCIYL